MAASAPVLLRLEAALGPLRLFGSARSAAEGSVRLWRRRRRPREIGPPAELRLLCVSAQKTAAVFAASCSDVVAYLEDAVKIALALLPAT